MLLIDAVLTAAHCALNTTKILRNEEGPREYHITIIIGNYYVGPTTMGSLKDLNDDPNLMDHMRAVIDAEVPGDYLEFAKLTYDVAVLTLDEAVEVDPADAYPKRGMFMTSPYGGHQVNLSP